MIDTRLIHPLTEFLRNSKVFSNRIERDKEPIALTVNGKVKLVMMDSETFEELTEIRDRERFLSALGEGVQAAKDGNVMSLEVFDDKMRAHIAIPN